MSKQITITLPDSFGVGGMSDAPAEMREVKTEKWDENFILTTIRHGVSQALRDTWSVSKKDKEKLRKKWESFCEGDWNQRERTGESSAKFAAKFDETIKNLNVEALAGKLTREQLFALASLAKPDNAQIHHIPPSKAAK